MVAWLENPGKTLIYVRQSYQALSHRIIQLSGCPYSPRNKSLITGSNGGKTKSIAHPDQTSMLDVFNSAYIVKKNH